MNVTRIRIPLRIPNKATDVSAIPRTTAPLRVFVLRTVTGAAATYDQQIQRTYLGACAAAKHATGIPSVSTKARSFPLNPLAVVRVAGSCIPANHVNTVLIRLTHEPKT